MFDCQIITKNKPSDDFSHWVGNSLPAAFEANDWRQSNMMGCNKHLMIIWSNFYELKLQLFSTATSTGQISIRQTDDLAQWLFGFWLMANKPFLQTICDFSLRNDRTWTSKMAGHSKLHQSPNDFYEMLWIQLPSMSQCPLRLEFLSCDWQCVAFFTTLFKTLSRVDFYRLWSSSCLTRPYIQFERQASSEGRSRAITFANFLWKLKIRDLRHHCSSG